MVSGKKIALILVYLGKWPIWTEAFLKSCDHNPGIHWLIFHDNEKPPRIRPGNVHFFETSFRQIEERITWKSQSPKIDHPIKLCDFKVMYGHLFEEYLKEYDYWGHCDLDVIWGDLERFLIRIDFGSYDLISSRYNAISGHFSLYRNHDLLKRYYRNVPGYQKVFESPKHFGFDEGAFSYYLFNEIKDKKIDIRPFWPARNCIDNAELERMPLGWYWKSGEIKNYFGLEGNYLHLIKWKKTLREVNISTSHDPAYFNITRLGIWEEGIPLKYLKSLLAQNGLIHLLRFWKRKIKGLLYRNAVKGPQDQANVPPAYRTMK